MVGLGCLGGGALEPGLRFLGKEADPFDEGPAFRSRQAAQDPFENEATPGLDVGGDGFGFRREADHHLAAVGIGAGADHPSDLGKAGDAFRGGGVGDAQSGGQLAHGLGPVLIQVDHDAHLAEGGLRGTRAHLAGLGGGGVQPAANEGQDFHDLRQAVRGGIAAVGIYFGF